MAEAIVEVQQGKLRGNIEDGVFVFKGVPYGADTGGEGRFKGPRPAEPWTGVRDALTYGPDSPQLRATHSALKELFPSVIQETSEDCLRLNVWTPALGDGGKRPGDGLDPRRRLPLRLRRHARRARRRPPLKARRRRGRHRQPPPQHPRLPLPRRPPRPRVRRLRQRGHARPHRVATLGARQHRGLRRRSRTT